MSLQQNQNGNVTRTPRMIAQSAYNTTRTNLLIVFVFTTINIILNVLGLDFFLLFSAEGPYMVSFIPYLMSNKPEYSTLIIFAFMGIVLASPYLFAYIFSKKHKGWFVFSLIYFSFDCLFLLIMLIITIAYGTFSGSYLLNVAFHVWIIFSLIGGIKNGKKLEEMPVDEIIDTNAVELSDDEAKSEEENNTEDESK